MFDSKTTEVTHRFSEGTKKFLREIVCDIFAVCSNNSEVLTAINNLDRKVDKMSSNLDRIEKEAADMAENVGLIRTAVEDLKAVETAMKDEIAALKEQVAKGQLDQARLDAAAAVFEKADDDIDAIVLPTTPPPAEEPEA